MFSRLARWDVEFSFWINSMGTDHVCLGGEKVLMYVGLDVHKKVCYGTIINGEGEVVKDGKFGKDPRCLGEFMENIDEAKVVMEAGYCWQPVYEWLERNGYEVKLAHPLETSYCEG